MFTHCSDDVGHNQIADKRKISKSVIRPEYEKYGKPAPLIRNKEIVERAKLIIALWDGKSRGTKYTIKYAKKIGKQIKIYVTHIDKLR